MHTALCRYELALSNERCNKTTTRLLLEQQIRGSVSLINCHNNIIATWNNNYCRFQKNLLYMLFWCNSHHNPSHRILSHPQLWYNVMYLPSCAFFVFSNTLAHWSISASLGAAKKNVRLKVPRLRMCSWFRYSSPISRLMHSRRSMILLGALCDSAAFMDL